MTAEMKKEVEKWLIANQTTYPQYFEGQSLEVKDELLTIKFISLGGDLVAQGCKKYNGMLKIYIYAMTVLKGDEIKDYLSSLLDELRISGNGFMADFDILKTTTRGNKSKDAMHFETIASIDYSCWTH